MKLLTIWCYYPDSAIECLDAWDEYTADDNYEGFEKKLEELRDQVSPESGRIHVITVDLPDEELMDSFVTPEIKGPLNALPQKWMATLNSKKHPVQ